MTTETTKSGVGNGGGTCEEHLEVVATIFATIAGWEEESEGGEGRTRAHALL